MAGTPKHRKGPKSKDMLDKEEYTKKFGGLTKDGKPWTKDDYDALVTLFVWDYSEQQICSELGRSWKSFDTYRTKIFAGTYTKGYVPKCLHSREGKEWNEREAWALRAGILKGWDAKMIARVIGRKESSVLAYLEKLQTKQQPRFGFSKKAAVQ